MTAEESLGAFIEIASDLTELQLVLGSVAPNGAVSIQRVNMHEEVVPGLTRITARTAHRAEDCELHEYEPGFNPANYQLVYLETSNHEQIDAVVRSLQNPGDLPVFEAEDAFIEHVRFYAFALTDSQGRTALAFRSTSPTLELTRKKALFYVFSEGTFDTLTEKVFTLDRDVDCFYQDGFLFVRNVASFEGIFGFFQQLVERAEQTFQTVSTMIPVANMDEFRQACLGDARMTRKLATIARKPYLATITTEQIRNVLAEHDLGIATRVDENGTEQLVFDKAPASRWKILKLLDDDFLRSSLTGQRYEVNSKRTL